MNLATALLEAAIDEGVDRDLAWRIRDRWLVILLREQPNRQIFNAGLMLCETAAPLTTRALTHIANVVNGNDGFPATTIGDGVHSSGINSTTERAALNVCDPGDEQHKPHEAYRARVQREDIRDYRHSLTTQIRDFVSMLSRILPVDDKAPTMLCDGRGFEGSEIPWTPHSRDERNGWHDPLCIDIADASKLCPRCKIRERRWREAHGLEPRAANSAQPGPRGVAA